MGVKNCFEILVHYTTILFRYVLYLRSSEFHSLIPIMSPSLAMFKLPWRSKNPLACYSIHFITNIFNL